MKHANLYSCSSKVLNMVHIVSTITNCPHLLDVPNPEEIEPQVSSGQCLNCDANTDNVWLCLHCGNCGCGRDRLAHAASHFNSSNHPISIALDDLTVWCYVCESYLDIFKCKKLHAPFAEVYKARFGVYPNLPGYRDIQRQNVVSSPPILSGSPTVQPTEMSDYLGTDMDDIDSCLMHPSDSE